MQDLKWSNVAVERLDPVIQHYNNLLDSPATFGNRTQHLRFAFIVRGCLSLFICRDTDSLVIDREREALREWMDSDSMIHVMRDHPGHWEYILGGKSNNDFF